MFARCRPQLKIPSRDASDAGYDVQACLDSDFLDFQRNEEKPYLTFSVDRTVSVSPGARVVIPTGLVLACGKDCYWRVAPRSGLALKYGIQVLAGVVDSGFRNEVLVILHNSGREPWIIENRERIAQIILTKVGSDQMLIECPNLADEESRQGFGSSGRFFIEE